ncbi:Chromo domain-containing protein 1 [Phytophthora citrophthora]|uniref:Chromo domain-containing protein 1 n=1 Tax=Phytophthora citrophthora TaxID=4793 RepID=A0AAD9LI17_9STRA|nr:Chromo domain-containing protein 1 [Phytophthora citrophthora]
MCMKPAMASDSDGSPNSTVVLISIRNKLVEYKESLLRQLLDEREAVLAASKEQGLKDTKESDVTSMAGQETALHEEEKQVEAVDVEYPKALDDGKIAAPVGELTAEKESENVETPEEVVGKSSAKKKTNDEVLLKKRRLAEEEVETSADVEIGIIPAKKAKKSKTGNQQPKEIASNGVKGTVVENETTNTRQVQEDFPEGAPYCVVRTSVPPAKYLMQKRREEEASDHVAFHQNQQQQQQQPVHLASSALATADHSTNNGLIGDKRMSQTSPVSSDSTNSEFERKLREFREIKMRSLTVTRKRQLPRLPTPAREEMKWMATDFSHERNWKRVMQHRLATGVIVAKNAESVRKEQENRQMARGIAMQISAFWRTMERIAARSRVRLEAAGTESSGHDEIDDATSGDHIDEDGTRDYEIVGAKDGLLALKYHTIDVGAKNNGKRGVKPELTLSSAKTHMSYIVSAGKRARSAMTSSPAECADKTTSAVWALREAAFRELHARCTTLQSKGGPAIFLAAFQLLALRWMLDLYSNGLNMLLNDQLGMGKATTIVAFLTLTEIVVAKTHHQQGDVESTSRTGDASPDKPVGPHLIIVSEEELHKWRYYLRIWNPDKRIQLYDGPGNAQSHRDQLQREWKIESRAHAQKNENDFLIAPPNEDDEDEKLDDDERAEPVYCVLCPVDAFAEDRDAFVAFTNWQMVVVENERGGHFNDPACVSALQDLRQHQRRILCNGQPIENWKNTALRLQYAEFLVREASSVEGSGVTEGKQHRVEAWPVQELQVERGSVSEVMQLYGKSSSVRASLWKASSQQEDTPQFMNALFLALSCLSLRRVRSEVESELGKIEEISLSCELSASQKLQYRNALSGFAATLDTAGGREERLSVWLQLLLHLREICNCVDIVNDVDKLGHADMRFLAGCSAKLETLEPLLRRLVLQEAKKVVIYCQFNAMFPILELFLSLMDINYVRVTGSIAMQRRALCHFADRPVVRVALASTRLSTSKGGQAVSVFGGEAIIVVDGDWNATCDAKLRASWAKMAVGGADTLPVYRLHCENTIEASLLRAGASLTEKAFGEMTPQDLLAVPSDMALNLKIEKPSWWSSTATSSGGNSLTGSGTLAKLSNVAQQVERNEKYCGDSSELESPLIVHNVDLDAEEHLLLANTDELTPVEWYAVNYVHGVTDTKHQGGGESKRVEQDVGNLEDAGSWKDNNAFLQSDQPSFEKLAAMDADRQWKEGDAASQLFFTLDGGSTDEGVLEKLFMQMRMDGLETHFDVYKPPQPPQPKAVAPPSARLSSEVGSSTANQMTFRVSYRVQAPPPPAPLSGKSHSDHAVDLSKLAKSSKKQRANSTSMTSRTGLSGLASGNSMNAATSVGVKRKLESQLSGLKSGPQKEQRVDLEGIPVPDVSEFVDDDFWGDTNLDALDSAEWDDPALLSGILGVGVGDTGTGASSIASSSGTASSGASAAGANSAAAGSSGAGAHADSGHLKTGQKGSKKAKTGTGRARKSSMSSSDSGRDTWSLQDDVVLKKLFELYGANWTLIAQVFNSSTAISRFVCKKRSPRQCYDRYGKIISGSFAASTTGTSAMTATTKDGKSLKAQRAMAAANVAAAQLTPAVLDARIGLPQDELLLKFPLRHSLPGMPPPSIVSTPYLVEMTLTHRKQSSVDAAAGKKAATTGGVDDLKSIKTSFDAIIQCMKHKTSPPPIPIPVGSVGTNASVSTTAPTAITAPSSTDLGTKASLTAASFPPTPVTAPVPTPPVTTTPTKASPKAAKKATVSPVSEAKTMPLVPLPHKSHTDMISLLPTAVLGPDEVIKRSKEAAVVAVQAAAAVASVGRDGSPLSASGDVMLGAGSGFGASVSGSMPRRSHAASITSEMSAVSVMAPSAIPVAAASSGSSAQITTSATAPSWGGSMIQSNGLNASAPLDLGAASTVPGASSGDPPRSSMPVTTSTLLHVLDRMPEIKNKIQSILNRTDCSESQKVAMIARLLSNTNAINNTNALGAPGSMSTPTGAAQSNNSMLSALTADPGMLNSSDMLLDTETPIPMPVSLAASSPSSGASSSALTSQGQQFQPPATSSQP